MNEAPLIPKPGHPGQGKLLVAWAIEIRGKDPGRARLTAIEDYAAGTLGGFIDDSVVTGSTVVSDGWFGHAKLKDVTHDPAS